MSAINSRIPTVEQWNSRPIEDVLKQRVKVLEEGLRQLTDEADQAFLWITGGQKYGKHETKFGMEAALSEAIARALKALDLQCDNCGDDGEEPSKNCPTCKGTGFKCLK